MFVRDSLLLELANCITDHRSKMRQVLIIRHFRNVIFQLLEHVEWTFVIEL